MPDRDLPDHLKDRLSAVLTSGAPLSAPLASQARYSKPGGAAAPKAHLQVRLLTAAAAAFAIVALVVAAGPEQPREWILQSVGNLAKGVGTPMGLSTSPSPGRHTPAATHSPSARPDETSHSPAPTESPEAPDSRETSPSPEPSQSPDEGEPTASPSGGAGDSPAPSPSPHSDD